MADSNKVRQVSPAERASAVKRQLVSNRSTLRITPGQRRAFATRQVARRTAR